MWSTWRLIPACLKSTPQDSTSHFPRSADVRPFLHPFRDGRLSRPLPLHAAPAYWPFLGTEAGPAINTSPVAIRVMTAVNSLEHFCSSLSAIWTTHLFGPPSLLESDRRTRSQRGIFGRRRFGERNDGAQGSHRMEKITQGASRMGPSANGIQWRTFQRRYPVLLSSRCN